MINKKQRRKNIQIVVTCLLEQFKGRKLKKDLTDLVETYYRLGQEDYHSMWFGDAGKRPDAQKRGE